MNKRMLKTLTVIVICFCLPLAGLGAIKTTCSCEGKDDPNKQPIPFQPADPSTGCCGDEPPPSNFPCPCSSHFCDILFNDQKAVQPLFTVENADWIQASNLKIDWTPFQGSIGESFLNPCLVPPKILYLQTQTLRC